MSKNEVLSIHGELVPDEDENSYSCTLASDNIFNVAFRNNALSTIKIINSTAQYPNKHDNYISNIYPAPVVEDPPIFQCPNLKLIVLDSLLSSGHIDLGDQDELASFVLGQYIEFDNDDDDESINGWNAIPECLEYLINYPLSKELLAKVKSLCFDGGNEIYSYIIYHWDGESESFDITSLKGIENLPNLKDIEIISMTNFNQEEREYLQELKAKGIEISD